MTNEEHAQMQNALSRERYPQHGSLVVRYVVAPTFEGDWHCTVRWPEGGVVTWYSPNLLDGRARADALVAKWAAHREPAAI